MGNYRSLEKDLLDKVQILGDSIQPNRNWSVYYLPRKGELQ